MGNKSSMQKREQRRGEALPQKDKSKLSRGSEWNRVRDLQKANQPRTLKDWHGMQEKAVAPKLTGADPENPRLKISGRAAMPVLYRSGHHHIPKRNEKAPPVEVNRQPQPWQKEAERKRRRAAGR